jgi:DNA polymerase I
MSQRLRLYIIDGHAVAYRQYHAFSRSGDKGITTSSGQPTGAVFGFTRALLDILLDQQPHYLAVSFDRGLSGRDTLFEAYKATRDKMPDDLASQLPIIHRLVEAFNIPVLELDGYEADDIIGTVAAKAEALGVDTHIITGDRDLLQLLTPHVTVQLPQWGNAPDKIYDEAAFREKYGLDPRQLTDLKGLMGDSSDNIPGVKGIGEKGGTALLQQYGTLEGIYEHIDQISGATHKKLIASQDIAFLSRQLATIQRDVPVAFDLDACVAEDYDRDRVAELFRELEFRSFADRLFGTETEDNKPEPDDPVKAVIVSDRKGLDKLVKRLNAAQQIVWDVETTSLDQMSAELVGIALAVDGQTGYYIPVNHKAQEALFSGTLAPGQLPLDTVLDALRDPLTDPAIPKCAHNAAFDLSIMRRYGIDVQPIGFDTMIGEWVRDPASKFTGLKNFAFQYLNYRMTEISELIGSGKKQIGMDEIEIERAGPYAAADAAITFRAADYLRGQLDDAALDLIQTLEMPFVPVIVDVEQAGVLLDREYLAELSIELDAKLQEIQQNVYEISGLAPFNISSPKQLNDVLFDKLGLPVAGLRKTTHGYSTDAASLEALITDHPHPVLARILDYRELAKLKGTYVDALPLLINPETGRVHTSYNQTGTSTGRLSSSDPNLQNIPIRTDEGRKVRRAFIAPPGCRLLGVDYSQIELRVLAHYSQDPTLIEAFHQGLDIHAATAAAVYGIPLDQISYAQRSFAKRVNFGLIYGMGAYRLARDSELTLSESRDFIDTYFGRMPRVRDYIETTKVQARQGSISTLFGRRRVFPELINARNRNDTVQAAERAAINMPIQGTAADIIKKAMIDLHAALAERRLQSRMILQVHDELVLEVPEAEMDEAGALVVQIMENVRPDLAVPLRANAQVGSNWLDMEPVDG